MISDLQAVLIALAERHEMDVDVLSNRIRENFNGSMLSLKQLEPLVSEILRRFKHLPRKQEVDSTYPNIAGYRTFKDWCVGVLDHSDRAVRYMLKGGNNNRKCFNSRLATVSVLDIDGVMRYLKTNLASLDRPQQEKLAQELGTVLGQTQSRALENKARFKNKEHLIWRARAGDMDCRLAAGVPGGCRARHRKCYGAGGCAVQGAKARREGRVCRSGSGGLATRNQERRAPSGEPKSLQCQMMRGEGWYISGAAHVPNGRATRSFRIIPDSTLRRDLPSSTGWFIQAQEFMGQ